MTDELNPPNRIDLAADIVSAFVSHNNVRAEDLPSLISQVHATLENLGKPIQKEPEKPTPLMPIKKTITPDYLISLEDGKQYRSLKRHLTGRGLTPEQYREKWGLARDYPMVAPSYSAQRSALARSLGLGQSRKGATKQARPERPLSSSGAHASRPPSRRLAAQ